MPGVAGRIANGAKTLLVVSPSFPPEGGGLEAYVANLVGPLAGIHGWRIVVATTGPNSSGVLREETGGLVVYRLAHQRRLSNTWFGRTWRRDLARIVHDERPDLINAHLPVPGLAAFAAGVAANVPLVVTYHGGSMRKGHRATDVLTFGYERVLVQRLLRRAQWIICSSDFVRDQHLIRFRTKCSTVTPGVECARFAPADRLAAVLDETDLGDRLGPAGRAKVEESYSWASKAAATNAVFDAVLARTPVGGKRRISVVAPHFVPRVGGLEQYAYQVARGLQESGSYEVQVLTSGQTRWRVSGEVLDGLTVLRFPTWVRVSNTPMSPMWPFHIRRALLDNRIELVNVHTPVPFMAEAAALGCGSRPLAVTYHAGSMVKGCQPADTIIRVYERLLVPRLLGHADAVVAVSEAVRSRFLRGLRHQVDVAPPAVDTELFSPAASTGPPTLLFVGRIERSSAWKGIGVLLRAFRIVAGEVPDARLVLVGGGDALADHREDAARQGIGDRVTFTGVLTGDKLVEAYRSATVVVLPSTTEAESFGMCLIEGMACAKPVIGSNVGGIPFVMNDGEDGLLAPPGDAEALAACCIRILRDPILAAGLGANGRRKVTAHYTWPSRVTQYDHLFQGLLDRGDPRQPTASGPP